MTVLSIAKYFQLILALLLINSSLFCQNIPWKVAEIGITKTSGSFSVNEDTVFIKSSGYIQGGQRKDKFYFVYQQLIGDIEITAKVASISKIHQYEKSGLIIRNNLDDNSIFSLIGVGPGGITSVIRDSIGGTNKVFWDEEKNDLPVWLKLIRRSNKIYTFHSKDGIQWKLLNENFFPLNQDAFYGLVVVNHKSLGERDSKGYFVKPHLNSNQFPDTIPPTLPTNLIASCVSANTILLNWHLSEDNDMVPPVYEIFCNSKKIKTDYKGTSYGISHLAPDSSYIIEIVAKDFSGNISKTSSIKVKTLDTSNGVSIPLTNPYKVRYNTENHWTNNIHWSKVTDARNVEGLISKDNIIDSLKLHQTLSHISDQGGGVLFFPRGKYFFSFSIRITNGVIIRGEDPSCIRDAIQDDYLPPTTLEFPKYIPSFEGEGTSNNTAFKMIYGDTIGVKNCGLVNLDIQRAHIGFYAGGFYKPDDGTSENPDYRKAKYFHENVIIYGIRQNNAAIPHPRIPTKVMIDDKNGWQRWVWPNCGMIHVIASNNCVVANCRINDQITDSYEQPGYLTDYGLKFKGNETKFDFAKQQGIMVNQSKIGHNGYGSKIEPSIFKISTNSSPDRDPELYGNNVEILDNYVCLSEGYKSWHGGRGNTTVKGNTVKFLPNKNSLIEQNGQFSTLNSWNADSIFRKDVFKYENGLVLPYRLMVPGKNVQTGKYPLVLYLHGRGEKGDDNESQMKHFIQFFSKMENIKNYPCFVFAPQCPTNSTWGGNSSRAISWPIQASIEAIKMLLQSYNNIDRKRIYVMGISEGGVGCWETIIRYPDLFAGAVPMGAMWLLSKNDINTIKNKAIWMFNGARDEYIPVKYVRMLISQMEKEDFGNLRYTIYPYQTHWAWIDAANEPDLLSWLFSKKVK